MSADKLLRFPDLQSVAGVRHRITLAKLMRDCGFPAPIRIGPRFLAWRESEVLAWLETRRDTEATR